MSERPLIRFGAGALLGVFASFSISIGLYAIVLAIAVILLVGVRWRSPALLAGSFIAIGVMWAVFALGTVSQTLTNGPGSGGAERYLPFFMVAFLLVFLGLALGLFGIVRHRVRC
jgi:hypothetical protein